MVRRSKASTPAGSWSVVYSLPAIPADRASPPAPCSADAQAAAQATLNAGVPGHLVTISDQAELDFILNNLAPSRPWIGLSQNVSSSSYSEPGGGWEWVTGEPFTFVNWSAGEPNDISGSGGPENDFTYRNTTFLVWNCLHLARMLKDAGGIPAHGNQPEAWEAGCKTDFHSPEHKR